MFDIFYTMYYETFFNVAGSNPDFMLYEFSYLFTILSLCILVIVVLKLAFGSLLMVANLMTAGFR